jgi:fibro-slime domain-containing protein/RHS repeat-associated protein
MGAFNFDAGNGLYHALPGSPAAVPFTVGNAFQVFYQTRVSSIVSVNPGGDQQSVYPYLSGYELTLVMSFSCVIHSQPIANTYVIYPASTQSTNSFVELYYDSTIDSNFRQGTGFNDGALILSAVPFAGPAGGGGALTKFVNGSGAPILGQFDQWGTNDYPGVNSLSTAGNIVVNGEVTYLNPTCFSQPLQEVNVGAYTGGTAPFWGADPSARFVSQPGGVAPDLIPSLGSVNGVSGPDFQFWGPSSGSVTPLTVGSLSGSVYVDRADNGVRGPDEVGIGGTVVTLTGTDGRGRPVSRTTTTRADGSYLFDQVWPGTYTLTEVQPVGYLDARDTVGSLAGTLGNDRFTNITLESGERGTDYNFGEHRAPVFSTNPVTEINAGAIYAYDADAADLEQDQITYSVVRGPSGLTVNSSTGQVSWSPTTANVGTHAVVLHASDGRGGVVEQAYAITVRSGYPNHPPRFTSTPIVDAQVGIPYSYQAAALDPDGDTPLTFDLIAGPSGLSVSSSGLVSWTPTDAQLGTHSVTLRVTDNRSALPNAGGTDTQIYTILVGPSPGNHPPVIISQPVTLFRPPTPPSSSVTLYATVRDFRAEHPDFEEGVTGVIPGLVQSTLGPGRKPIFAGPDGAGSISNAANFAEWYSDVRFVNRTTIVPLTVTQQPAGTGPWIFNGAGYYPIDDKLFGDEENAHNQHFTLELHASFTYRAGTGQTIEYESDDDGWIFIDNRLAVDVGGVHPPNTRSINLDTFGLVDGRTYAFDLFFAERHTDQSTMRFQTNFPLEQNKHYIYDVEAVDPDNDPITYSLVAGPSGMSIDPNSGLLVWDPTAAQAGSYPVTVRVADGRGGFDQQSFTLVVQNPAGNAPPVFQSNPPTRVLAGDAYTHTAVATDPDGDPVTYSVLSGPSGMVLNAATGEVYWETLGIAPGWYDVSLAAHDGRGGNSQPQSFAILVTRFNNGAPIINSNAPPLAISGQEYLYPVTALDPENDPLEFDLVVRPAGMVIGRTSGRLAWTPTEDQVGTHDVIIRVRDVLGATFLQAYQVTVSSSYNHPPLIVSTPPYPALQGLPYTYQVVARDIDPVDTTFTYDLVTKPTGMNINASGLITWTPTAGQSSQHHRVVVKARDPRGAEVLQSFTIRVDPAPANRAPVISSLPRTVIRQGDVYIYAIQASDPDLDALTYNVTLPPSAAGMVYDSTRKLIKWPVSGPVGTYGPIQITVTDSRGLSAPVQTFSLTVASQDSNREPQIVSAPVRTATYGRMYAYDLQAVDPDGDPVEWSLDSGPAGMLIDRERGTLRWTPTADQLGDQAVTVRARDPKGGMSTQSFTITARGADLPPRITSFPETRVKSNTAYTYAVTVEDPDDDPRNLIVSLPTKPSGMAINYKTNLVTWTTPSVGTPTSYTVTVQVDDGRGGIDTQTFTLIVDPSASATNRPPTIDSKPVFTALVGSNYQYTVAASDPDGGTLTYTIDSVSPSSPSWLSINGSSGLLQGTPTAAGTYTVTVKATDPLGASAYQQYTLLVRSNTAPTISSMPVTSVVAGQLYRYDVVASDPNGDPFTYHLQGTYPQGMSIDPVTGRITWATTTGDANTSPTINVVAVDSFGASSTVHTFPLTVSADTARPFLDVAISANPAPIGSRVTFLLTASDNVGVTGLTLSVNGTQVALDAHGSATLTMGNTVGPVTVIATARDAAGNVTTVQPPFSLFDPTDVNAPTLALTGPADGVTVTTVTAVTGTVTDSNLASWTLDIAPLRGGSFRVLATGTSQVTNGLLGQLDPTVLANGPYTLRLTARDTGGKVSTIQRVVNVVGDLKLGNLSISFTDLTIPVAGIPITIKRSYDTLRADRYGEVGFGWRLDFGDMEVKVSTPDSSLGSFGDKVPFRDGTRVVITGPDGVPQGFTFQGVPSSGFAGIVTGYRPVFIPDADVLSRLTVPQFELLKVGNEYISLDAGGIPYDPADPAFGGTYTLTTLDGLAHTIDATTGQLLTLSDRNKNTLTFEYSGITSDTGRAVSFTRDGQGRITAITDPRGHSIIYGYNTAGDLVSVTDRENKTTTFTYNAARPHYLEKVIDPLNRTVAQASYDTSNRVSSMTDAAGKTIQNTYNLTNPSAPTQTITDQDNKSSTLTFDTLGNITKVVDAASKVTKRVYAGKKLMSETQVIGLDDASSSETDDLTTAYTYNTSNLVASVTDPTNRTTRLTYDAFGQPKTVTTPSGETTTSTYDLVTGNLLSQVDPAGNSTSFSYDSRGNATRIVSGLDGMHWYWGDPGDQPNVAVTSFHYDQYGQVDVATDARGVVRTITHDANGNSTGSEWTWVNPENPNDTRTVTKTTVYDNEDRATVTTTPTGVTITDYDALGRDWRTTDPLGGVTETVFDARGLAIQTTTPDGRISRTVYDAKGRPIWVDDPHLPAQPTNGTKTIYDALDRVVRTERHANVVIALGTDASGAPATSLTSAGAQLSFTASAYDDAGRLTLSTAPVTATTGQDTTYEYDDAGRQTAVETVVNGVIQRAEYGYDSAGRQLLMRDALDHETHTIYDDAGRPIKTLFHDGSYTLTAYDQRGRKIAETDQLNRTTDYEYDRFGNLTAVVLPEIVGYEGVGLTPTLARPRYEYSYDDYGNLVRVRDTLTHDNVYAYDELGRRVSHTLPLGQVETWRYNTLGQQDRHVDFTGTVEKLVYDTLGRLQTQTWHASETGPALATVTYSYDNYAATDGVRRDTIVDSRHGTADRFFDREGRLIKVLSPEGTVEYAYDSATGRQTRTFTAKTDLSYSYDVIGRLKTVVATKLNVATLGSPLTTTYSYDAANRLVTTTLPNGTTETRTHDDLNRLTSVVTRRNSDNAVLTSFAYTLDLTGRRTAVDELNGRRVEYTYDDLGRLTQEQVKTNGTVSRTLTYKYDRVGNRRQRTDSGENPFLSTVTSSYDANDRLTTESMGQAGSISYGYDAAGRLLTRNAQSTPEGTLTTHTWDAASRLVQVQISGGSSPSNSTYIYNSSGIRVSQTVGGQQTKYLIDETAAYDQVLEEYAPGGVLVATYVRGHELLFQDRGGVRSYYAKDGLGSTRALTSAASAVTDTYTYDAYGRDLGRTGTTINPFQYAGEQLDGATRQYYLRARYYDPAYGRFTQKDSFQGRMEYPLTLHKYAYTHLDPVNNTDPSGHETLAGINIAITIGVGIPIGLGAASSAVYAKVLGGHAGKGFIVGVQLGVAFDIAYFTGGGGIHGLKNFTNVLVNSFWTGVIKLTSKHLDHMIKNEVYTAPQQARDFYEAFSSAAFYKSLGDWLGDHSTGDHPGHVALINLFASAMMNFLAEIPEVFTGEKSIYDGISNALQNTEVSFLQSNLVNEAIKDFPTALGRTAVKTALALAYQSGTDAILKIIQAMTDILGIIK